MHEDTRQRLREAVLEAGRAYPERGFSAPVDNFREIYAALGETFGVEPELIKGSFAGKSGLIGNRRVELLRTVASHGSRYSILLLVVPEEFISAAQSDIDRHPEWGKVARRVLLLSSPSRPQTLDDVQFHRDFDFSNVTKAPPQPPQPEDDALIRPDWFDDLLATLRTYKAVLIEGVPGTGKTHAVSLIDHVHPGRALGASGDRWAAMTLHPSVSYEDFVEGLRPSSGAPDRFDTTFEDTAKISVDVESPRWFFDPVDSSGEFRVVDGFFVRLCRRAAADPDRDFVVLLDELNRANVPRLLGDLLTTLEASKRARWSEGEERWDTRKAQLVTLPYSGRTFFVPDNVYVVSTINGTDRSLAPLDDAIRRRFASIRTEPLHVDTLLAQVSPNLEASLILWSELNEKVLRPLLGPDGVLGHSYFFHMDTMREEPATVLRLGWRYALLPQLISLVERSGAEDLFAGTEEQRREWLSRHGNSDMEVQVESTLANMRGFLGTLGIELAIEGTGLERRIRITDDAD